MQPRSSSASFSVTNVAAGCASAAWLASANERKPSSAPIAERAIVSSARPRSASVMARLPAWRPAGSGSVNANDA